MPDWIVYIMRCADDTLYTGITTDLEARLIKHNAGIGAKYTRSRLPVVCAWQEQTASESSARKREAEIKKLTRLEKLHLIQTRLP